MDEENLLMVWPIGESDDRVEQEQRRDRILHTVGNLTLVNGKLNPAISNAAWEKKRVDLAEHSLLRLNQKLVAAEAWDEDAIRARGESLCEIARKTWPKP